MNRREFMRAASAAAIAVTTLDTAATPFPDKSAALCDVNVTLGRWPFRRLPLDETARLLAKLRTHGVTQAWAATFDAVFGKNLTGANSWLAEECRRYGDGTLLPFGTVNLVASDWEAEFNRCVGRHRMKGLRLFPNYHGYDLTTPSFSRLSALAQDREIVLQIAVSLEDERTQPASASVPHVDVQPLVSLPPRRLDTRLVLLNWQRAVKPELVTKLAEAGVYFDIATVENVGGVAKLLDQASMQRVLFGSHAPCFYFESAVLKVRESSLNYENARAVCELNARQLLT